jgi:hypothetical protein
MSPGTLGAARPRRHEGGRRDRQAHGHGPPSVPYQTPQLVAAAAHPHRSEMRH